ncbi:sphingolipid delta-4 desaturase [Sorochytrium milnesiophthora]
MVSSVPLARKDSKVTGSPLLKHADADAGATLQHSVGLETLKTNGTVYADQPHYPPANPTAEGFPGDSNLDTATGKRDFHWEYTEEPHATRRKVILQKYPEIAKLFGPCSRTKYTTTLSVAIQLSLAVYFGNPERYPTFGSLLVSPLFWAVAYAVGATINHSLFLAIHEITHGLAFKSYKANKIFSFFANLPIGLPYAMAFQGYHKEHHTMQGVDGVDTDLPTELEGKLFSSVPGKLFFCIFQILFYALRPMLVRRQRFTQWHLYNAVTQLCGMVTLQYVATHGTFANANAFLYLMMCTFLSGSLHPMAGHFIAEHYIFVKGYETYSYYGMWNVLAYNVGYHNEHHDFPLIPGSRLPEVRRIAAEYYDHLPQVNSWAGTIYNFITMPHMSAWSRVKRRGNNKKVAAATGIIKKSQ